MFYIFAEFSDGSLLLLAHCYHPDNGTFIS